MIRRRPPGRLTRIGLLLAAAGPPLLALAFARLALSPASALLLGQLGMLALAAAVALLARAERIPPVALGLRHPGVVTLLGGVALAAAYVWLAAPLMLALLRAWGSAGFAPEVARLAQLPSWMRAVAVVVAGTVEEWLYRGYLIERLTVVTGSVRWAAVLATVVFSAAHIPLWGIAASSTLLLGGALGTAVYLWRRDLVLNMLAHVVTDAIGLLL